MGVLQFSPVYPAEEAEFKSLEQNYLKKKRHKKQIMLTQATCVECCHTWRTGTGVAVHFFLTRPTVLTGEGQTVSRDAAAVLTVRT